MSATLVWSGTLACPACGVICICALPGQRSCVAACCHGTVPAVPLVATGSLALAPPSTESCGERGTLGPAAECLQPLDLPPPMPPRSLFLQRARGAAALHDGHGLHPLQVKGLYSFVQSSLNLQAIYLQPLLQVLQVIVYHLGGTAGPRRQGGGWGACGPAGSRRSGGPHMETACWMLCLLADRPACECWFPACRKQFDAKGKLVDRPAPAAKPAADAAASMSTS